MRFGLSPAEPIGSAGDNPNLIELPGCAGIQLLGEFATEARTRPRDDGDACHARSFTQTIRLRIRRNAEVLVP